MFTGSTPNLARTNWNINAVLPQLDIPQEAKDILARLMIRDPTERATATQILQEPWITQGLSTDVMQMNDIARQNSPQQLDMDAVSSMLSQFSSSLWTLCLPCISC
jgi:serine/threonine protein kinase